MKRNILMILALVASLALLTGCGGDDDTPTNPGGGGGGTQLATGTITMTFDGNDLDFSEDSVGTDEDPGWYIFGGHGTDPGQTTTIRLPATTGTYTMGDPGQPYVSFVFNNAAWLTQSGTMTITAVSDSNIEGTFTGTFENLSGATANVTAAHFDVPIMRVP